MIELDGLTKVYGSTVVVDSASFQVKKGEILAFLGPNGAGKSTTMKMLTGYILPSAGKARVGGKDIVKNSLEVRAQIGYLPETAPSYLEMSVHEFLSFMGGMRGLRGKALSSSLGYVMELTGLTEVRDQIIDTLSKGYRQRVCFSQALLHNPPVLILDEPTDGLDPNQKHEMREVIRQMRGEKTVILSTHILEEMEAVCTRAVIIAQGKIVADATPEELQARSKFHGAVLLSVHRGQGAAVAEHLASLPEVQKTEMLSGASAHDRLRIFPRVGAVVVRPVLGLLEKKQIAVEGVYTETGRFDEVFRQLTMGGEGD